MTQVLLECAGPNVSGNLVIYDYQNPVDMPG